MLYRPVLEDLEDPMGLEHHLDLRVLEAPTRPGDLDHLLVLVHLYRLLVPVDQVRPNLLSVPVVQPGLVVLEVQCH